MRNQFFMSVVFSFLISGAVARGEALPSPTEKDSLFHQFRISSYGWSDFENSHQSMVLGLDFRISDRFSLGPEAGTLGGTYFFDGRGMGGVGLKANYHVTGSFGGDSLLLGGEVLRSFGEYLEGGGFSPSRTLLRTTVGYQWVVFQAFSLGVEAGTAWYDGAWSPITGGLSVGWAF